MTQEEKQLVLQDLCARLPYPPICHIVGENGAEIDDILTTSTIQNLDVWVVKPYLRPMSSMTEEEKKEYIEYAGYEIEESVNGRHYEYYLKDFCGTPDNPSVNADGVDWLNKKMFDFRGLISRDLALSTDKYNPYKD